MVKWAFFFFFSMGGKYFSQLAHFSFLRSPVWLSTFPPIVWLVGVYGMPVQRCSVQIQYVLVWEESIAG